MEAMPVIHAKVRAVGNSLGVILPKTVINEERIKEGDMVAINILKPRKINLKDVLGIAKDLPSFDRDESGRD